MQNNTSHANEGGISKGPPHSLGGIKFDLAGKPVELEGDEIVICKSAYDSPRVYEFNDTPYDILMAIQAANGCSTGILQSIEPRQYVICKKAVRHGGKIKVKGTARQIIDIIQGMHGCVVSHNNCHGSCKHAEDANKKTFGGPTAAKEHNITNTFKDKKGRNRFEIDDSTSVIDDKIPIQYILGKYDDKAVLLQAILKEWAGYKYYPEFKNIPVIFIYDTNEDNSFFASYYEDKLGVAILVNSHTFYKDYEKYKIFYNSNRETPEYKGEVERSLRDIVPQLFRRKLFHELSHAIQHIEGIYRTPSRPSDIYKRLKLYHKKRHLSDPEFIVWIEKKYDKKIRSVLSDFYQTFSSEKEAVAAEARISLNAVGRIKTPIDDQYNFEAGGQTPAEITKNNVKSCENKKTHISLSPQNVIQHKPLTIISMVTPEVSSQYEVLKVRVTEQLALEKPNKNTIYSLIAQLKDIASQNPSLYGDFANYVLSLPKKYPVTVNPYDAFYGSEEVVQYLVENNINFFELLPVHEHQLPIYKPFETNAEDKTFMGIHAAFTGDMDGRRMVLLGTHFDEDGAVSLDGHKFLFTPYKGQRTNDIGNYCHTKNCFKHINEVADVKYPSFYRQMVPKNTIKTSVNAAALYNFLVNTVNFNLQDSITQCIAVEDEAGNNLVIKVEYLLAAIAAMAKLGHQQLEFALPADEVTAIIIYPAHQGNKVADFATDFCLVMPVTDFESRSTYNAIFYLHSGCVQFVQTEKQYCFDLAHMESLRQAQEKEELKHEIVKTNNKITELEQKEQNRIQRVADKKQKKKEEATVAAQLKADQAEAENLINEFVGML